VFAAGTFLCFSFALVLLFAVFSGFFLCFWVGCRVCCYCLSPATCVCLYYACTPLLKHVLCFGEISLIYIIHLLLKKKLHHGIVLGTDTFAYAS
jgi:hypothetical protein